MIDREHDLPITRQAQLLNICRGSVYYLPRPVGDANLALMRRIDELHLEHPFMGARMLRRMLQREGVTVRRHVATLMQRMDIEALCAPNLAPPRPIRAIRSTHTCCASWPSPAPTRCGRSIRPTSRWPEALCT
jgi:putative transposase